MLVANKFTHKAHHKLVFFTYKTKKTFN